MQPFTYLRASTPTEAVDAVSADAGAAFVAGGSNLIDHLRLGIVAPSSLVDVTGLGMDELEVADDGALRIGANVANTDLAADPGVRRHHPVIARAVLAGASGQIRNQASTAGNLLQRTRCVYFQDRTTPCNKREPGSGCSADDDRAYTRYNAVLGTSPACVAVHPSDLAVALAVCDATVVVLGPDGERRIPYADLHRLPGDEPQRDTTLAHGELITAIEVPAPAPGTRSTYVKVRDRASFAFALVSVAALTDGTTTRIAWGGVAHRPWRASAVEERLGADLSEEAVRAGCAAELADVRTWPGNDFKPAMVTGATVRACAELADGRAEGGEDA